MSIMMQEQQQQHRHQQLFFDWSMILHNFNAFFEDIFSTSKKAHFDNVPSDYKVVDGARSKWSNLLILDGFIYLLDFDEFNSASRRAFNQHQVLHRCILDEFKRCNEDVWLNTLVNNSNSSTEENNNPLLLSEGMLYDMIVVENTLFPWTNLQELRNYLLIDPTAKSRGKYLNIIDSLFDHVTLLKYGYDLQQIIMHVIVKSLVSFKETGGVTCCSVSDVNYGMHKSAKQGIKKRATDNVININISKQPDNNSTDYVHKLSESLSSSSSSSQDTTACINSILRAHALTNQSNNDNDNNDYNNNNNINNDSGNIYHYNDLNNNNNININKNQADGFMTLKQLVDQQKYLQPDNINCNNSCTQLTSNEVIDHSHMSELSIFNNSTSSLDHPSTCSLTIDMDMNDSSMFTCSKMTKDYKSDNGIKPYADNHSDDRYSFDPHVFDDSDEDVLTMHDYDTGVLSINGRNDNNNNIYDHHHDIDGDDVREELGSPWDLLDDWALIVDTPLRIDDDDNERLFPSTTVDMSFSQQQQQQQQQCNCASDDHHPYNYYNNNGHNSSTEQQGRNHHSHNTALMIGSRGNNNYQPMIGINSNNRHHSDCICSSMVPFPIDISPGCKKHSLFAKRTEFQRPMDYYSNNSSVAVHSRNNPQTTHIGRDMETAATSDRSIAKRVKSVLPGAAVRYKKDGSVAKKIGRPPKKATTINKANKRNNNNNNDNNNSINIQQDNNSINNRRDNYGYRSNFDNNNNNNNTIIINTPISMNVSTVSDPVEEQQQQKQQQQSSGWTSLGSKRSSNYIDSHSRKYTKM